MAANSRVAMMGRATVMACPVCMSVLYEVADGETSRFCCSEGHSFALDDICPGIEGSLKALLNGAIHAVTKR